MIRHIIFVGIAGLCLVTQAAYAQKQDVEPRLAILPFQLGEPVVALTFDACSGQFDQRIADILIADKIPATIFVTHRWLKHNPDAVALLLAHADLFEIENHGDRHIPLVTDRANVFGLKTAGSISSVKSEIDGGEAAIIAETGEHPTWFRGATARYSRDAIKEITAEGYKIAGYSLNADMGAALSGKTVAKRIAAARPGDVIIAHINQPTHSAGKGVVDGIKALEAKGMHFVRLDQAVIAP